MTDAYSRFPARLRAAVPSFAELFDEHLAANGEVLPHVLLGELVRHLSSEAVQHGSTSLALRQAIELLDVTINDPDPRLQELVVVSFLENLDPDLRGIEVIRSMLSPRLNDEYSIYWGKVRESP